MSSAKFSSDKTSLGYVVSSGPSTSMASGSRTIFMPQSEKGNKGKKSKTVLANSKSFVRPHVCHHCGVSGHIRPNCFKLYPHKQLSNCPNGHRFFPLLCSKSCVNEFQENGMRKFS